MSARTAISTTGGEGAAPGPAAFAELGLAPRTVCVLAGGRSNEREVSLDSGRAVLEALATPGGPGDGRGPGRVLPVEIERDGRWRVGEEPLSPGRALEALAEVDVFFLALHGGEGEGGTLQGFLRTAGRAFTGSDVAASAVALDKVHARDLVAHAGFRVAPASVVEREAWQRAPAEVLAGLAPLAPLGNGVPGPEAGWAVKPRCGGSSVGAALVRRADGLREALEAALREEDQVLVEALVPGVELTVAVLVDADGAPRTLTPVEIRPHEGRFFDYEEKYSPTGALELCPPETVPPAACARAREIALAVHRLLGCAGYSRTDFLLPPGQDEPVFLELNTLPGLTPRSLVPLAAAHDGIDYRTLCLAIAADGWKRGGASGGCR